jgi:hypothetical protein
MKGGEQVSETGVVPGRGSLQSQKYVGRAVFRFGSDRYHKFGTITDQGRFSCGSFSDFKRRLVKITKPGESDPFFREGNVSLCI